MNGGIDNQVQERMAAYAGNPDALMQKYQQDQQLIDLLALQKMKSEKEAAAREMQMAMQSSPQTIAQQREEEVKQLTQQEIAQQMGIQPPQGMPPQGMPPQAMEQGLGGIPMPQQGMAAGGIVAFAEGGDVDAKKRAYEELKDNKAVAYFVATGKQVPESMLKDLDSGAAQRIRDAVEYGIQSGGSLFGGIVNDLETKGIRGSRSKVDGVDTYTIGEDAEGNRVEHEFAEGGQVEEEDPEEDGYLDRLMKYVGDDWDAFSENTLGPFRRAGERAANETAAAYEEGGLPAAVGQIPRSLVGMVPGFAETALESTYVKDLIEPGGAVLEQLVTGGIGGEEEPEMEETGPAPIVEGIPVYDAESDNMPESWKQDEEKEFDWDKFWKTAGAFGRGAIKGDSSFGGTIAAGSENVIAEEAARNAAAVKALAAQREGSRADIETQLNISKEVRALDELMAEGKSEAAIAMMSDPTYSKAIETLTERLDDAGSPEEAMQIQQQITDLQKQFMKSLGYDVDAMQAQKRRLLATQYSVQRVK